ncbi:MAG TPA: hypothetical protein VKR53_21560 [Puia sp.]|nr:hypothetical protein [Puia sp.]
MKKTKPGVIAAVTHDLLEKAGEKVEAVKESLIAGKNKVVNIVEEKVEAAKKVIHDHTAPAKKTVKKKVVAVKKAAVKPLKKGMKKVGKKKPPTKIRRK